MQNPASGPITPPGPRRGFTLIELLIVIVIIALLAGLLFPAIFAVSRKGRVVQVRNEISQLETAIVAFKSRFAIEPPSSITIAETEGSWPANDRALIHRMWQQFDFSTQDRNGDGDDTDVLVLDNAQCLLFFLGGVIVGEDSDNPADSVDDTFRLAGFSKNPRNPFLPFLNTLGDVAGTNNNSALNVSESRDGPFFEFSQSRVQYGTNQFNPPPAIATVNQFRVATYLDPLPGQTTPYAYLHNADYNDFDTPNIALGSFAVYKQSDATGSYYKESTFQIVSPGFDGQYGYGGIYEDGDEVVDHDGTVGHINFIFTAYAVPINTSTGMADPLNPDDDNITNFAPGTLRQ